MVQKFLSIIIPVYNVEEYLERCVDSIVSGLSGQEGDYELILIDDGSSDKSSKICDDYKIKYNNIIVFHQVNSGVSVARNKGVDLASGKYVAFVDSDDYVTSDISKLISNMKEYGESDVYEVALTQLYIGESQELIRSSSLSGEVMLDSVTDLKAIVIDGVDTYSWARIVKKSLLFENNIVFPKGRNFGEDYEWYFNVLLCCNSYCVLDLNYYRYIVGREGALTSESNLFFRVFKSMLEGSIYIYNLMNSTNKRTLNSKKIIINAVANHMVCSLIGAFTNNIDEINEVIRLYKENKNIFLKPSVKKFKFFMFCAKLFGVRLAGRLIMLTKGRKK